MYAHKHTQTHTHIHTGTNPVELSKAQIPYILPALQGTIRISREEEIHIPAHIESLFFPSLPQYQLFSLKEEPEAPLDRIWTKKWRQSQEK